MKFRLFITCMVTTIVATMLVACGEGAQRADMSDFTMSIYRPSYAAGFEILGCEDSANSLVRITRPWQGDQVDSFELLILRDGHKAPADFHGAVIDGAAKRIVVLSSSNVAMFDRLDQVDHLVGLSGLDYISSESVKQRAEQGLLHDVGYDTALNYELLTILRPDIVLLYSVAGANSGVTSKLDEMGINYLYIGDYAEESPLGKAEWIVAMGEICGKRHEAEKLFEQSAERYNSLAKITAQVSQEQRPAVMLNTPYRDIWYMPSSKSYMVRLLEDAGARYIYQGNDSSSTKPISVEEAYALAKEADFWLNTGATINSMVSLRSQAPKFMEMPMVRRGAVYNNTARSTPMGGSDFWESGVVYPERVLEDLIEIFHPDILDDSQLYYYKQLK